MSSSSETQQQPARPPIVGTESGPEPPYPIKMFGVVERGFGRGSKELGIPTANLPRSSIAPLEQLSSTGIYFGFARLHPIPSSSSSSSNQASKSKSNSSTESIPLNGKPSEGSKGLSVQAIESLPGKTAAYPRSQVEGEENDRPSTVTTISSERAGADAATANGDVNVDEDKEDHPVLGEEDYKVWPMVMSVGYNPYYGNKEMTAEVHIMHQFPTSFYSHPLSVVLLGYVRPELNYVSKEKLIEDINEDVRVALRSLGRKEWAKWADARELEVPRDGEAEETKGDDKVEEVSKGVEGLKVGKEEEQEEIEIKLEFGGGLHLLFSSRPKHTVKLPKTTEDAPVTIRYLIKWMKDNLLSERVEMFGDGEGVRPGILVLVNDTDWELEGELDYRLEDGDEVVFISTLHGG